MSESTIRTYYAGRADSSRRMAERAVKPQVAAIHRELAERYDAMLTAVPARD